ncbi:MAG: dihydroorotate dehydrogenase [Candidatus Lokiarchaeota archaeon]|nr:dihydroorotate dehydrogenase [Candidatus Harpocratesius repetitus]
MNNSLSCQIAGILFPNPIILASGILGITPGSMLRLAHAGIGGITTKTVGPRVRPGYSNPSIIEIGEGTFLNSVGLANPGIDQMEIEIKEYKQQSSIPLIVSVFGDGPEGYAEIARRAEKAGADAIEINISCPHAEVASIALSEELTIEFTKAVKRAVSIPVFAKLTPNIADIIPIAKATEKAGADAIVAINTLRGLALDYKTGRPLLSHGIGGLSGKAIKSVGVRVIYELYPHISIPLIGVGGIFTWQDVLEYIYAGASTIQIGSALFQGDEIIPEILDGLFEFLKENQIENLNQIRGKAHEYSSELEVMPKECL